LANTGKPDFEIAELLRSGKQNLFDEILNGFPNGTVYDFLMGVEPNHRLARALAHDLPPGRKAEQGTHAVALHTDSRLSSKWLCPAEVGECRRGFFLPEQEQLSSRLFASLYTHNDGRREKTGGEQPAVNWGESDHVETISSWGEVGVTSVFQPATALNWGGRGVRGIWALARSLASMLLASTPRQVD
jgi:hypothetical protein